MAKVWIPSLMRHLVAGQEVVDLAGRTVGTVIDALEDAYPGVKERLCAGDRIDPAVAVHVDGRVALLGLLELIGPESEIHFLPAIAGG